MVTFILDDAKTFNFQHQIPVIPCNALKRPIIDNVVDKRGSLRTIEELEDWFGTTGSKHAQYFAALLDSPEPLCALDLDRMGVMVFMTKLLPRCSEQLQREINTTMRTQTPSKSLHLLFRYRHEDFPNGIRTHEYWNDLGPDKKHNQINLMGTSFYLMERGPGYDPIIGPESLVTLSKITGNELIGLLIKFESETQVIRNLCQSDRLVKYYQKDNRDKLVFHLAGYLHKNGVPEYLIRDLVECLIDTVEGDEEAESRFDVIAKTCSKRTDEVNGRTELLSVLNGDEMVFNEIKRQFKLLGYISFSYDSDSSSSTDKKKKSKKGKSQDKGADEYEEPKEIFVRKYSTGIPLAEQIKIGGRSKFLQIIDGKPVLSDAIDLSEEKSIILKPHQSVGSIPPIIEYDYNDVKEIEYFIELARKMYVDDFYFLVKSIFKDVVSTNEKELLVLLSTDTVMSYFQDLFVTVHYLLLTGPPGWGKGAILVTFKLLGYRVILAGDMSGANLLDLLGSAERCQVSIAEDELDNISEDPDKQRIYKMGYEDIGLVTRTVDPSSSNRDIKFYNPYCIKIFGSEKTSNSKELAGFDDRLFRSEVKKGKPKILVKEIKKQMERPPEKRLPKYKKIVSRINFLRKISLIFRLLHHDDTIEEVPLNIFARPLELCGPAIRVFNSGTLADPSRKALPEIMNALSYFLKKKGELDKKKIESVIYDVLNDLFEQMDVEERAPGTSTILDKDVCQKEIIPDIHAVQKPSYLIIYDEICRKVMKEVEGSLISQRTFESPDHGRITHDSLLEKCRRVFKGEYSYLGTGKDKKKALRFDKDAVSEAGKTFDVVSQIKILDSQDELLGEDAEDSKLWNEWTGRGDKL